MAALGIIPDIHNRVEVAQRLIDTVDVAGWVLLGDYFDDWGDTPADVELAAQFVKEWLHDPRIICLLGNHDQSYRWGGRHRCSGWDLEKHVAINSVLTKEDWARMPLYAWVDEWLLSHAGLDRRLVRPGEGLVDTLLDVPGALEQAANDVLHPLLRPGRDRGGSIHTRRGGLTWGDWENLDIPTGAHQLVGHTPSYEVREKRTWCGKWRAVCLDTRLGHYGVLEDGELVTYEVPK